MQQREAKRSGPKIGAFMGLGGASFGIVFALWSSGAVNTGTFALLLIVPVTLFALALPRLGRLKDEAGLSLPSWRYQRDFFTSVALYMIGMGIAISLWNRVPSASDYAVLVALLPALPTLVMIYVMARYVVEEKDEYLRHRTILSALIGLGGVLALGSFWGFMETFGVVPNIFAWWVVPVWAICFGIGQAWIARRDETADGAPQ